MEEIPKPHRLRKQKLVYKFACTAFKGDWEWHAYMWQLTTKWNTSSLCHLCRAARRSNHGVPFSMYCHDFVRRSAAETVISCMPAAPCPLVLTPGWHPQLIRLCAMHVLNLGLYQTLCAEGLLWLAENGCYGLGDLNTRLRGGYEALRRWMRAAGLHCSGRQFSMKRLHVTVPEVDFPYVAYKAFNCRILLAFLAAARNHQFLFFFHVYVYALQQRNLILKFPSLFVASFGSALGHSMICSSLEDQLCDPAIQRTLQLQMPATDLCLNDIITTCVHLAT